MLLPQNESIRVHAPNMAADCRHYGEIPMPYGCSEVDAYMRCLWRRGRRRYGVSAMLLPQNESIRVHAPNMAADCRRYGVSAMLLHQNRFFPYTQWLWRQIAAATVFPCYSASIFTEITLWGGTSKMYFPSSLRGLISFISKSDGGITFSEVYSFASFSFPKSGTAIAISLS